MIPNPSPLRKIVPVLVWPAGILLLVGYCFVGERMQERRITPAARQEMIAADRERAVEGGSVVVNATQVHSVSAPLVPMRVFSGALPLVAILSIALVAGVVWRTNAKDKAERERTAREMP